VPKEFRCWQGAGCARCGGHGSYGRIACIEFLKANAALRNAISLHPTVGELRRLALQAHLIPLRDSALALVRQGKISFGDLPSLVPWERLALEIRERAATP
jgi:type IV pilus assembly protein PilB